MAQLVTRTEIADALGTAISTVMSWIYRYPDFPQPVIGKGTHSPRCWWPEVAAYCEAHNLPRRLQSRDRDDC